MADGNQHILADNTLHMQTTAKKCMIFLALGKVMCMKWGAFKRGRECRHFSLASFPFWNYHVKYNFLF